VKPFVRREGQKHWFVRVLFVEFYFWKPRYWGRMQPTWGLDFVDGFIIHTLPVSLCFIPVRWLWER
jgi:hypothetical protein